MTTNGAADPVALARLAARDSQILSDYYDGMELAKLCRKYNIDAAKIFEVLHRARERQDLP